MNSQQIEIIPKSYPTNLLNKDWSKRKSYFSSGSEDYMKRLHDLQVNEDDVWVVTIPKSGTTWMQELVWLVMNNFDFDGAKQRRLEERSPFLEFDFQMYGNVENVFQAVQELKRPRLIKSHLCLPLLPAQLWDKKPKTIYVFRNPKDAFVSRYYHGRMLGFYLDLNIEQYIREHCMNLKRVHEPFYHASEFYALRNEPWLYYTSYEQMKLNLAKVITDVCGFLNKTINAEIMEKMLKHLSFDEMKRNPNTNHAEEVQVERKKIGLPFDDSLEFIRKGQVNGHKEDLSPEFIAELDKWIKDNYDKLNVTLDDLLLLK